MALMLSSPVRQEEEDEDEEEEEDFMLLMVAAMQEEEAKMSWKMKHLTLEGRRRRDRRIPREALLLPKVSPWQKLYHSRNDQALITVTGLDHDAFNVLLVRFTPFFSENTPWTGNSDGANHRQLSKRNDAKRRGRKRLIKPHACLGIVLAWYRFRGSQFILQGWFGFTGTHASVWLRFGRRMLLKALRTYPLAVPSWPDHDKVNALKDIVANRHPTLGNEGVFCVADGLKLNFESCKDMEEQGMYYNGWTHGHYITNLFVFGVDGRIIRCVINVPGSVHDSTLCEWGKVYDQMEEIYQSTGGKCCVDSAFASEGADYLIRSAQDITNCETPEDIVVCTEATSLRQAAEWGMRAIQGAFPRLKDAIKYEVDGGSERRMMLKLVVLLYNFRLEHVGLNQIRNTYVPEWSKDASYFVQNK
jgi:hypothetical protein